MREQDLLINRLKAYGDLNVYPFHMPGHKRMDCGVFPDPFTIDITEIDGFDNLHHPEGIIRQSMDWAAGVYGADSTHYLVNGSTCGILAAICGLTPRGGRILISRNCHKSAYHGIYLNQLKASYVYPQAIEGLGIQGGIMADDVDKMLRIYGDIKAVLIVSPTYDGVVSDVCGIAKVAHRAGLPLIVDEAHGAHFCYSKEFPRSALELGADVVIQSVHKTLPSLTQTALLHIKNNRPGGGCYADARKIERFLQIYQTSSPSYVLMASIEHSIYQMNRMAQEGFQPYLDELRELRSRLEGMNCLRLVGGELRGTGGVFDLDITKIVVSARYAGITGAQLDQILRREYQLEMEMCGADYVTAITTQADSTDGLKRLGDAFLEIDRWLCGNPGHSVNREPVKPAGDRDGCIYSRPNETVMSISEAMDSRMVPVSLENSGGWVSGEFVYIYPPGIPILAPGERISPSLLALIEEYKYKNLPVQGPEDKTLTMIQAIAPDRQNLTGTGESTCMEKLVIVINGKGGVGKDTMCDMAAKYYAVENISSITPVKELAAICGWNGEKDEKSRKFLSDLKLLLTNYNDYPTRYLMKKYSEFMAGDKEILFVHIRECEEIDKFKSQIKTRCITLLIKRTSMGQVAWGNASDDMAEDYDYDYEFDNCGSLEESETMFLDLLKKIIG